MAGTYFRKALKQTGEKKSSTLAELLKKTGDKAYKYAEKSSRRALSMSIANLPLSSAVLFESHKKLVNCMSSMYANGILLYSRPQVASLVANKLKFQDAA